LSGEILWLQPYPDQLLDELPAAEDDPDAAVVEKETIELAFPATTAGRIPVTGPPALCTRSRRIAHTRIYKKPGTPVPAAPERSADAGPTFILRSLVRFQPGPSNPRRPEN